MLPLWLSRNVLQELCFILGKFTKFYNFDPIVCLALQKFNAYCVCSTLTFFSNHLIIVPHHI
ncbi:unnamed protein product [Larinioides sclopetarius]|uniref:Uncharacterized protein n=1 Tax=Larinioides sclopetarius TaxID=280406 RepID=A0AAV2BBZ5_9ARAC